VERSKPGRCHPVAVPRLHLHQKEHHNLTRALTV
jgi:hypothetical protein